MDIVINARDNASGVIENVRDQSERLGRGQGFNKFAAGVTIAGGALEYFAREQATLNEQVRNLGNSLGMADDEVRDLAVGLSDVTLPLDEVLGLMEVASQRGVEGEEGLKKFVEAWDLVGDATGLSATELANGSTALQAVGIDAENTEDAFDAFGYITRHTTSDVNDFITFIERSSSELRDYDMDVNDVAATMGILEGEFGMTARTARQEFRSAMNEADGDLSSMYDNLGITGSMLDEYNQKIKDSSGVLEENAESHADSYTFMQRLQSKMEDLAFEYGEQIQLVGDLSNALVVAGPLMKMMAGSTNAFGTALVFAKGGLTKLYVMLAPLLIPFIKIIAVVAALIAIGWLLYENWEHILNFGKKVFSALGDGVSAFFNVFKDNFNRVRDVADNIFGHIGDFVSGIFDSIQDRVSSVADFIGSVFGGLKDILVSPFRLGAQAINSIIGGLNTFNLDIPEWLPGGGGSIGFNIPKIPEFHTGGVFRAGTAGGEGIAKLKDRERVVTAGTGYGRSGGSGGEVYTTIINLVVDGKEMAKAVVEHEGRVINKRVG